MVTPSDGNGSPVRAARAGTPDPANAELLAAVARLTAHFVIITDGERRITWVNDAFCQRTGFSVDEARGRRPADLLHGPLTDPVVVQKMRAALAAGHGFSGVQVQNYTRERTPYWADIDVQPVRDASGRVTHYVSIQTDVTERRTRPDRLAELSQRLALALGIARLGVWERAAAAATLVWDEHMFRMFGRAPASGTAAQIWADAVHVEDLARVQDEIEAALTQRTLLNTEFRVCWPDGSVHWHAARGVANTREAGAAMRLIGVQWDITDLKLAQDAQRAREAAERANRAKSEFLARMSHELRTPLNAIIGFAQLLELDAADPLSASQNERVGLIRSAGWHVLNLINDVLDLSRIESGRHAASMEVVALAPLLDEALALAAPLAAARGVRLERAANAAAPGAVWADRSLLKRVLVSLASHGIRFNRPGGAVMLSVARPDQERVAIIVRDSSAGLTPRQIEQLFEPFNRIELDGLEPEGTGIGLVLSQRLAESMRGTLDVASEPGVGNEFRVLLNAARVEARAAAATRSGLDSTLTLRNDVRGTVLYIEDNPANSLLVEQLLQFRPEINLYKAADGATGLVLAAVCQPDLILVDMRLPDMHGLQVLKSVHEQSAIADIPCVAVSANAMPADIQTALQSGFRAYWTKPLDAPAFLAGIDSFMQAALDRALPNPS